MVERDVERDGRLGEALDGAGKNVAMLDIAGRSEYGLRQRLRLGSGLAVVQLVEEIADAGIFEQALGQARRDGEALGFRGETVTSTVAIVAGDGLTGTDDP